MATSVENAGDLQAQVDEVEALSSIYGDEWCVIDEASRIFCIKISADSSSSKWTVCLQIILPPDYPSASPPIYQLNAAWLRGPERTQLSNMLEDLYVDNAGESILYLWVEKIREFLVERSQTSDTEEGFKMRMSTEEKGGAEDDVAWGVPHCLELVSAMEQVQLSSEAIGDGETPLITHGQVITDRRSTFQPHLAPVVASKQVKMVLDALYENKKIASATHNIYAYRIFCEDRQTFLQDCEDDGETAAGGRLLHLMQILDVRNVMVVVSRWYGGILLGPDRFKHICNCARGILVQEGYVDPTDESAKAGGRNKKQKGKKAK
ncbi:protein IMPACT [Brienomyrus brachyistius]|uniref:protein IMPACT n=1 Tax=Brienomyrus brachyistius TaxID=42636 RepID=UPI0020B2CAFB|nr:protein IMPACT [Brienomyrus brachyistius]XP_048870111.1 protein IMPACT [Brienomyrus brachyistius]